MSGAIGLWAWMVLVLILEGHRNATDASEARLRKSDMSPEARALMLQAGYNV